MGRSRPGGFIFVSFGLLRHPKVQSLSDSQVVGYIGIVSWCAENETDGRFSLDQFRNVWRGDARNVGRIRSHLARMVLAGLIDECDDGLTFCVHDFADWQETKAEKTSRRAADSERQREMRDRKRHGVTSRVTDHQRHAARVEVEKKSASLTDFFDTDNAVNNAPATAESESVTHPPPGAESSNGNGNGSIDWDRVRWVDRQGYVTFTDGTERRLTDDESEHRPRRWS